MIPQKEQMTLTEDKLLPTLQKIFLENQEKRIVVVATTCSGKSTLLKQIPEAHDMDDLIFPLLSQEESNYVCKTPWTKEIGDTMSRLTKERVRVEAGRPVLGHTQYMVL